MKGEVTSRKTEQALVSVMKKDTERDFSTHTAALLSEWTKGRGRRQSAKIVDPTSVAEMVALCWLRHRALKVIPIWASTQITLGDVADESVLDLMDKHVKLITNRMDLEKVRTLNIQHPATMLLMARLHLESHESLPGETTLNDPGSESQEQYFAGVVCETSLQQLAASFYVSLEQARNPTGLKRAEKVVECVGWIERAFQPRQRGTTDTEGDPAVPYPIAQRVKSAVQPRPVDRTVQETWPLDQKKPRLDLPKDKMSGTEADDGRMNDRGGFVPLAQILREFKFELESTLDKLQRFNPLSDSAEQGDTAPAKKREEIGMLTWYVVER